MPFLLAAMRCLAKEGKLKEACSTAKAKAVEKKKAAREKAAAEKGKATSSKA